MQPSGSCRKIKYQGVSMRIWMVALVLVIGASLLAFGRPASAGMGEDDFRKLEQAWLNAAAVPDLPALRKMLSDDFMGTSFGSGVLSKSDVVPSSGSGSTHMPKCALKDSTV